MYINPQVLDQLGLIKKKRIQRPLFRVQDFHGKDINAVITEAREHGKGVHLVLKVAGIEYDAFLSVTSQQLYKVLRSYILKGMVNDTKELIDCYFSFDWRGRDLPAIHLINPKLNQGVRT